MNTSKLIVCLAVLIQGASALDDHALSAQMQTRLQKLRDSAALKPRALGSSSDYDVAEEAMEQYFDALSGSECDAGNGEDVADVFVKDTGIYLDPYFPGLAIGRSWIEDLFDDICDVTDYDYTDLYIDYAECDDGVCSFIGEACVSYFGGSSSKYFFLGSAVEEGGSDKDDKKNDKKKRRRLSDDDVLLSALIFFDEESCD